MASNTILGYAVINVSTGERLASYTARNSRIEARDLAAEYARDMNRKECTNTYTIRPVIA